MTLTRRLSLLVILLLLILSACTPRVQVRGSVTPEQTLYNAPARTVFAIVVQTISEAPAPRSTAGWEFVHLNRESGYIVAQAVAQTRSLNARQGITVRVIPNRPNQTAVVMQFTKGEGKKLASRIRTELRQRLRGTLLQIVPRR